MSIGNLAKTLKGFALRYEKVQTAWGTIKAVDWDKKTATVTGMTDALDYFDVNLGLGHFYRKPKSGSLCLIGMVENQSGAAFLIDAEEVEAVYMDAETEIVINGGGNEGIAKSPELVKKINALEDDLNSLKNVFSGWAPASGDGGAALKLAAAGWIGQQLNRTAIDDIQNKKLKH